MADAMPTIFTVTASRLLEEDEKAVRRFEEDGAVIVRGVLDGNELKLLEDVFYARLADPETTAPLYAGDERIVQSHGNSARDPLIVRLLAETALADLAARLFRGRPVWYWSEQAWWKKGGAARRTAWHQDLSYVPFAGPGFAVLWIPLDPLPAANALEVVAGSHRRTLYNGSRFDPTDDVAPLFDAGLLPTLPDIEADRGNWPIIGDRLEPGDVLVFHPACLHGGAPAAAGQERRSMSFRFFTDDVVYRPLPSVGDTALAQVQEDRANVLIGNVRSLTPGDPIHRCGSFQRIRA